MRFLAPDRLLIVISSSSVSARAARAAAHERIESFRTESERLFDRGVESFRHRDRFQLHERRQLFSEWQGPEFLSQFGFGIVDGSDVLRSRRSHHDHVAVIFDLHLAGQPKRLVQLFRRQVASLRRGSAAKASRRRLSPKQHTPGTRLFRQYIRRRVVRPCDVLRR